MASFVLDLKAFLSYNLSTYINKPTVHAYINKPTVHAYIDKPNHTYIHT